jgi:predicted GTPase
MIPSSIPVVSVGAVRTGAGKSQTTRKIADILKKLGKKVVVVRHPMPYGDLTKQICQRFETEADLDLHHCTIEEREEYSPHLSQGIVVYAGVDYGKILEAAQQEAEIILWDGGNNDFPFYQSNLHVVVTDPHRAGHEVRYHPGETNLRMADVIIINKTDSASPENVDLIKKNIAQTNRDAIVIEATSPMVAEPSVSIQGKKFLAIEDGPTVTHGEMGFGAAYLWGKQAGGIPIHPKPYAVGSLKDIYNKFLHLKEVLPAMGYSEKQLEELSETIENIPCDFVVIGTPADLRKAMKISKPIIRVSYYLKEKSKPDLQEILKKFLEAPCQKNSQNSLQRGKHQLLCNHTMEFV